MLLKEEGRGIGCVDRSGGAKRGEQPTKKSKKPNEKTKIFASKSKTKSHSTAPRVH